ncbi:RNA polymerase sigma factor [Paucibacter sp. APW11]|uniref:RNA polymerase sigma factor n=1 Tax=Roseateles aquae TaxID=3077235 RepID=A0ABU3PE17_9BURK|nr:RNA polymerase sigma factor [Paucibacter sp. APW11]MDT9000842.1 RNA polymerase sigma factor [Paucibacter sp. APW11]
MDLSGDAFSKACRDGGHQIESWLRVVDREHGARFYREAAAALRSWQEAEDVVQEAMIKVWQRCASFRGVGDPIAWIHQIVRHTLLDALDKRRPQAPLLDDSGELTAEVQAAVLKLADSAVARPEQQLAEHQLEQVFKRCFERFAAECPLHATVLRWVVDEGLDNSDIERLLDRSPGATREFISQCRKKARPYFAEWHALVAAGEPDDGQAGRERRGR